jgi:4-hydroxy-tetrahydrodipicolinate reductase
MGRAVIDGAIARGDVKVVAALDRADSPNIGQEIVPGLVSETGIKGALDRCDVYIDFTMPAATRAVAEAATRMGRPVGAVVGTTGLGAADEAALSGLAKTSPIVVAANFSLGVNLLLGLVEKAARALGTEWDAEIVETHHRAKRDAPSGTALMIGRAIAAGHGSDYDAVKRHARDGEIGPRPRGEIGVSTVRGGDVVGEHVVTFYGAAERIEIGHRATSRAIFAAGALRAASWLVGKPPGRYDMLDVLGLR